MEELFNRVLESESSKKTWRKDYGSIKWKEASKVNKILNGIPLNQSPRCECLEDLFFQLKRLNIKQTINTMETKQFFLKDVLIMLHGCQPISNKSTDEQMIALLKISPAHISKFEKFPENWKEICGVKEDKKKSKTPSHDSENDADNSRELELMELTNGDLKVILLKIADELPKPANKKNLVASIIATEKL